MNNEQEGTASGHREIKTGAKRNGRTGKGRFDLLPPRAIRALAVHFEGGADRFGDRNWEKGMPLSWFLDSALRHGFAALEGRTDEDHATAAMWNWGCFVETRARIREGLLPATLDDLPHVSGEVVPFGPVEAINDCK